jgi:gliding motility-associated protein GldL
MANFTQSKNWKSFMSKLYGFGAALVIVGALFKLMHWTGAGIMLTIGMATEAIIFIFSAFDPPPHETDWTRVFPELEDGEEHEDSSDKKSKKEKKKLAVKEAHPHAHGDVASIAVASSIDLSGVDTSKLASGIKKLGETADKLNDLSATVASANALSEKMQQASISMGDFSQSYERSSQVLSESINILSGSYQTAASNVIGSSKKAGEQIVESGKQVSSVINNASESFAETFSLIDQQVKSNLDNLKQGNGDYQKNVESLNKHMAALNTIYELQVQDVSKYSKNNVEIGKELEKFVVDLQKSAEENKTFHKGISSLNDSIAELNNIYGNMLSAVHVATKKK